MQVLATKNSAILLGSVVLLAGACAGPKQEAETDRAILAGTEQCTSNLWKNARSPDQIVRAAEQELDTYNNRVAMHPETAEPALRQAGGVAPARADEGSAKGDGAGQSPPAGFQQPADATPTARAANAVGLFGDLTAHEEQYDQTPSGGTNIMQVSNASEGRTADPDVDPSGEWMVYSSTRHHPSSNVYLQRVNGKTVTQLTSGPYDDVMPRFSPDGKRIAFASNRSGNWNIYIMSIEGGQAIQVTEGHEHTLHPTWSPDGEKLAFCRLGAQSQRWEIWSVRIDQPSVEHFLDYGLFPRWSPDIRESRILFQRARKRGSRYHSIWTVEYVNGEAVHPTEIVSAANAAIINPAWSPDGQRIVFVTVVDPSTSAHEPPNASDIWMVNLDGTGRINLTDGQFANYQPVWANDGNVYFVSNRNGVDNIWALSTRRAMNIQQPDRIDVAGVTESRDSD